MVSPRLEFTAQLDGDLARIAATCACGVTVRTSIGARELHGEDRSRWDGADARAERLRAMAYAMEAASCSHALHDLRVVTPCLLRPSRSRAAAVVDAAADLAHARGAEAWEALASRGLIPMEWLDDDSRRFVRADGALAAEPEDFASAAVLAVDVEGARRAEAVARELVWRMRELGLPQPARVAWRRVDPAFWTPRRGWYLSPTLATVTGRPAPPSASPPWWDLARFDLEGVDAWRDIGGAGPNPFEPLAALWSLGYAVDAIDARAVVLAMPPL